MQRYRLIGAAGRAEKTSTESCPPRRCRQKGSAAFDWSAPPPLPKGGAKTLPHVAVKKRHLTFHQHAEKSIRTGFTPIPTIYFGQVCPEGGAKACCFLIVVQNQCGHLWLSLLKERPL